MAHIHEKIDFVSEVFIVNRNAVLLRIHDKYKVWLPPGGHIELDEEPEQAAVREAMEEVGIVVNLVGKKGTEFDSKEKELMVPRFMNRHRVNETHEHISFVFFGTSESRVFLQGETEISDDIRWFTKEELEDSSSGVSERVKYYAIEALKELAT